MRASAGLMGNIRVLAQQQGEHASPALPGCCLDGLHSRNLHETVWHPLCF